MILFDIIFFCIAVILLAICVIFIFIPATYEFSLVPGVLGVICLVIPLCCRLLLNVCESCSSYSPYDFCTTCGDFLGDYKYCECGIKLYEQYDFCPSCGLEVGD